MVASLKCIEENCRDIVSPMSKAYVCPTCGGLQDVVYDFQIDDPEEIKHLFLQRRLSNHLLDLSGVWRYRELLPFCEDFSKVVSMQEGNTPIYEAPRCAEYVGLKQLHLKHQGLNPTGSFKDNGMTAGVTQANLLNSRMVACASTGNTSASMAAYASRAGMKAVIFIPDQQIAFGKLAQSLDYGALTLQLEGDFDESMKLVKEITQETDVYLLNSINPFRLEGQKAIIIEMLCQRDWQVPDRVVVPGGNLGNSASFGKAIRELHDLGFIRQDAHGHHHPGSKGQPSLPDADRPFPQAGARGGPHPGYRHQDRQSGLVEESGPGQWTGRRDGAILSASRTSPTPRP